MYGTPCHDIGRQVFSIQTVAREAENFPRCGHYHEEVAISGHIFSLLATSLMNKAGLIFMCQNDVFTCGEDISKLAV